MGRPQFLQEIGGDGGQAIATTTKGTIETDNYSNGSDFQLSGGETLDPAETIQELTVTRTGDATLQLLLNTVGGDQIDYPHNGGTFVSDKIEIDSIEVQDPGATGESITGVWVGE